MRCGRRGSRGASLLPGLVALALACGRGEPERPATPAPLETVDVKPAPDAGASLAAEPVELRRETGNEFSGVLPEGFPSDVPVLRPSSLVDVALGPGGALAIELASPATPQAAGASYARLLAAAGWKPERRTAAGAAGLWRKDGRALSVELTDTRPGCRLRIALVPR